MGIGIVGKKGVMGPLGPPGRPGLPGLAEQKFGRGEETTGPAGARGMKGAQVGRGVALVARLAAVHGSLSSCRSTACRFFPFLLIGPAGITREERRTGEHGHRTRGPKG